MTRTTRSSLALALVGLLTVMAVGPVVAADGSVSIEGFAFSPSTVTVKVGDSVTWTNNDSAPHTATADDGSFDTEQFGNGESSTLTFSTAGSFAYHCTIHPQMHGTVVVEAAATAAPTATADSGGGGGGSGATPAATDTLPVAAPVRDDASTVIAVLLAILGLSMLLGTYAFDRRSKRLD
jgi:plastocyanin